MQNEYTSVVFGPSLCIDTVGILELYRSSVKIDHYACFIVHLVVDFSGSHYWCAQRLIEESAPTGCVLYFRYGC